MVTELKFLSTTQPSAKHSAIGFLEAWGTLSVDTGMTWRIRPKLHAKVLYPKTYPNHSHSWVAVKELKQSYHNGLYIYVYVYLHICIYIEICLH